MRRWPTSTGERQRIVGDDGHVVVPWRVVVVGGTRHVTVHYFTASSNEPVGLEVVEGSDEVRLTIHERVTGWEQSGASRSASVTLQAP